MTMHVLAICGSLRAQSSNLAVLQAARQLAKPAMEIVIFDGLADLPHFNPDLDGDRPPKAVATFREAIGKTQGLLISSPEYARGVAGVLKNALDWLVSSTEFPGKAVAVINASQRATHADAALRLTLTTMSANLVEDASIMLPLLGRNLDAGGIAADADLASPLALALHNLGRAIIQAG